MSSKQGIRSNKWKKASFKLAAVSRVQRRQPQSQKGTAQGTAKSGKGGGFGGSQMMLLDTASVHTSASTIVREMYQPKYGYDTKTMQRFREYLKRTDLEPVFEKLLTQLLNRHELPYNPYPGFADRIYSHVEKFHLYQISEEKIQHALRNSLRETNVAYLYTVRNFEMVWGLSSILRVISAQRLSRFQWVVDDLTLDPRKMSLEEGYTADVILSVVGPCVFEGTFFSHAHNLQIRKEYVLYGEDSEQGVTEFVKCIEVEINEIYTTKKHQILGVHLLASEEEKEDHAEFWDLERIAHDENQDIFLKQLADTVQANKFIKVECVFLLDPNFPKYMRGQIQYGLNFITIDDDEQSRSVTT